MDEKDVYIIRPGVCEYIDLCEHDGTSRSDFFNSADVKKLKWYGLILETEAYVKVFHNDDLTDDSEGAGIVIPRSCVISIAYFKVDEEVVVPVLDLNGDVN